MFPLGPNKHHLLITVSVLEADYSVCLQLLLKYPPPDASHGPHTFVDDALFLQTQLTPSRGSELITKYTNRAPAPPGSVTPGRTVANTGRTLRQRSKSPLLQQQPGGGVEAFLQGAAKGAKGVLERGERLGINQAVREAMGELKRNMQNFNDARAATIAGKQVATEDSAKAIAILDARNKQLASFLDETVANLRAVSSSGLEDKVKSLELIEVAAAKVQFVQIYLQDSTMEVPSLQVPAAAETKPDEKETVKPLKKAEASIKPDEKKPEAVAQPVEAPAAKPKLVDSAKAKPTPTVKAEEPERVPPVPPKESKGKPPATPTATQSNKHEQNKSPGTPKEAEKPKETPTRPSAVPTRSSIAQSSFSWMLEPDESSTPKSPSSSSMKSPTSTQHKKRSSNNMSRERNAFLFGDASNDEACSGTLASDGIFGMESIHKGKAK